MNQQTLYPSSDESNPVGHVDTQTTAQKLLRCLPYFMALVALCLLYSPFSAGLNL